VGDEEDQAVSKEAVMIRAQLLAARILLCSESGVLKADTISSSMVESADICGFNSATVF
jgi:hypothetical protein